MKSFIATLALAALASGSQEDIWAKEFDDFKSLDTKAVWEAWKENFGRDYGNIEVESEKYMTFLDNLQRICDHNSNGLTFALRLNQFGDMSNDEFRKYVHGESGRCARASPDPVDSTSRISVKANPASIDWTDYNGKSYVTPVKNQGQCGSCWAFATTGSLECRYAINGGALNSLSEQQLVDCTTSYGNYGCDGGWWYNAYKYIEAEGGLCTEEEYPYTAKDGSCKEKTCGTLYDDMKNYYSVPADNGGDLETAVASGCVAVGVEADQYAFQFYSSGVLTGTCGTSIDHGVLVVGYGTSASGEEYWKVKNSWGETWGEEGYLLICKDCNKNGNKGECGINMYPAYPNQF